ncbi:MAG TPA: asparagine synthase-related protein [Terriglobales bacterium]|nr:asparagine synthase-related protein [Terriglobales bacterium]
MNGFLAVINLDGSAVDRDVLARMSKEMQARACVRQETWVNGEAGFAVGWPDASTREVAVSGEITVLGDIRLDARQEIGVGAGELSDARVIAEAYRKWERGCVGHLLGDFAFVVFDSKRNELLCARDHFGIKPLFYAVTKSALIISNTIECVIAHPEVSDELNEIALADFLLFDHIQDTSATSYRDVLRLPPAHLLTLNRGLKLERYWTLPTDCVTRFRSSSEYVEHYVELLKVAVQDRVRDHARVAVMMSGGLDSTSVAALAKAQGRDVAAFTLISEANGPDPEKRFSKIAADALGIPLVQHHQEAYQPFAGWDELPHRKPEPSMDLFPQSGNDFFSKVAEFSPAALSGYGGDPGLYPSAEFVRKSLRSAKAISLLASSLLYVLRHGKLPNVGLRTALRRKGDPDPGRIPGWLNPEFVKQCDLEERWVEAHRLTRVPETMRPEAYRVLMSPGWEQLFWLQEAGFTGVPLEVRHPMFDLRVLKFLLGIPPIPWCVDKELLRVAMKDRLPKDIRFRPKTTAGTAVPVANGIAVGDLKRFGIDPLIKQYVNSLPEEFLPSTQYETWSTLRPWLLNLWLRKSRIRKTVESAEA